MIGNMMRPLIAIPAPEQESRRAQAGDGCQRARARRRWDARVPLMWFDKLNTNGQSDSEMPEGLYT